MSIIIQRYLDDSLFPRFKEDFGFLFKLVEGFYGELHLALRNNYFNMYYKGNSLAKVEFKKDGDYKVTTHKKFYTKTSICKDPKYPVATSGDYITISVGKSQLHPLLQKKHLLQLCAAIKDTNYGEEITFEQMLITDNYLREDLILIDRQVQDAKGDKKYDLLGLKQIEGNKYRFLVIEAKMGKNPELASKVGKQLTTYVDHIQTYFDDYKTCYEKNYHQQKDAGLLKQSHESIEILPGVDGLVVVGGYSGLAKKSIDSLKKDYPSLRVVQLDYYLNVI